MSELVDTHGASVNQKGSTGDVPLLEKPHLLVCFSGSVASIKATMLVRQLKEVAEVTSLHQRPT
jgi:hypothetical protein